MARRFAVGLSTVHRWAETARGEGSRTGKRSLRSLEQDGAEVAQARAEWRARNAGPTPERFVFLDESAALTDLGRSEEAGENLR